jgi:MULE transposase domain
MSSLFEQIDNEIDAYRQRAWPAVLPFNGFKCSRFEDVPAAGNFYYHDDVDLFEEVRNVLFTNIIIRFDPGIYPINGGWDKNSGGQKLLTALCAASQKSGGCDLKCNGGKKKGSNKKSIFCPMHRQYNSLSLARKAVNAGKPQPIGPVRSTTYHCDRTNTRGKLGQSMKKRTATNRPLSAEGTCKVHLILDYDHQTFFLKCGIGQGTHMNHMPMNAAEMTIRAKFIDEEMINYQKELAIANIQPGKTAAAFNTRFGIRLTRRQVAYHQGFAKLASSLADATDVEGASTLSSDLDILIDILKKKGASFCALYHRSKEASASELPKPKKTKVNAIVLSEEMLFTETGSAVSAETLCEMVWEPGALGDDMMKYARESRVSVNADDNQDVLLGIVWVLPTGKQLFRAYSEVMFIDGTHKTNKENRPLITMGIKDCYGKMQIILRAFVPNERAWLFRWLFQVATPSLLGTSSCELVRLQITDGDSQETSQLDQALKTVFKNSKRRRCGWHIIEKGWERNVSGLGRTQEAKHIESVVKHWIYSLMKDIETDVEYRM